MDRQTAYSVSNRKREFLKELESNGFVFDIFTFAIRSKEYKEPLGVLLEAPRNVYLILPQDLGKESDLTKNERQRLRDLADKF